MDGWTPIKTAKCTCKMAREVSDLFHWYTKDIDAVFTRHFVIECWDAARLCLLRPAKQCNKNRAWTLMKM